MQGRNLEDVAYQLALPGLFSLLLSYSIQDCQPRDGTTHGELGSPILTINQEHGLQLLAHKLI